MATMTEYEDQLASAIDLFHGHPMTPQTIASVEATVLSVQRQFLSENPSFVAPHSPRVDKVTDYSINVVAPIVTVEEKLAQDHRDREAAKLMAELRAKMEADLKRAARAEKNMIRYHRKLVSKHLDKVPPATASIWHTLSAAQQYAILKDIDYTARHHPNQFQDGIEALRKLIIQEGDENRGSNLCVEAGYWGNAKRYLKSLLSKEPNV